MSDFFTATKATKETSAPSVVDNIFSGMMNIGNLISKGISFQFGPGSMNVKPIDYGLTGLQATYTLNKADKMDPTIKFWLKAKW